MAMKTYSKTSRVQLTTNFKVKEFACHGKGCCNTVTIDTALVDIVQKIRDHFGKPVNINSGYRCPTHNKNVGGVTGSYHAKGKAADISVVDVAPAEVAKYAESIGVKGIGLYETSSDGFFVHVDTRTRKSFWYGQKQAYRSTFGGAKKTYTKTQFVKDIQKAFGAAVDGIAGPETLSKTITLSAKENTKHAAVKAVQKYLIALGYNEVGAADGETGPKFTSAVAHFQKDNGCEADGIISAREKTWCMLLGLKYVPVKETKPAYTKTQFVKDIQKACGADIDGIAGPETLAKTITLSAKTNRKHAAVKPVQKYLAALGYTEIGIADGEIGPKFISAVAHFQQDNGCEVDGIISARNKTWKKLLGLA